MKSFEIYPKCHKKKWIKVGAECFVHGEGVGVYHKIDEVDNNHCRAAVSDRDNPNGSFWESFDGLHRPSGWKFR